MAKKDSQMDEGIIDLTELIETGPGGGRAAAAYAKNAKVPDTPPDEDDFGAILAQTQSAPTERKVDPDENLDMSDMGNIDDMFESLDIPAQPRDDAGPNAEAKNSEDMDSVLDDLLGMDAPPKKSAPAKEPPAKSIDDDLDNLLEGLDDAPAAKAPAKGNAAPEKAAKSDLDMDLDEILGEIEPPAPPKAEPVGEIATDLDDLLGDIDVPAPPKKEAEEIQRAAVVDEEPGAVSVEEPPAPSAPVDELDDLLADAASSEKSSAEAVEGDLLSDAEEEPNAAGAQEETLADQTEPDDTPLEAERPTAQQKTVMATETGSDSKSQALAVQALPADIITGLCHGIATAQSSGTRETLQEFSRELGAQSAHVEDMGSQLAQLAKRLLACESKVSASRARIASVEKGLEATKALDDLLKVGTPLHAGFMALIANAVSSSLQGFVPPQEELDSRFEKLARQMSEQFAAAEQRLEKLEQSIAQAGANDSILEDISKMDSRLDALSVRIDGIEKRLDEFSGKFGSELEKAASAAAARVLQEEISRLLQE